MALRWSSTEWVMMAWGPYPFALATAAWQTLRRSTEWRWPGQPLLGAPPARQFTGRGDDQITLEGTIHPHFRGGLRQVQAMRLLADRGEPQVLVDGRGNYYGRYVCARLEEVATAPMGDGAPRQQDFRMVLEAAGGPGAERTWG